jgi:rSAM/selenodomain-associated transferase 1
LSPNPSTSSKALGRSTQGPALAVFARRPSPGSAKTRLIPLLGPRGASELHAALVRDVLRKVEELPRKITPYLFLTGRGGDPPHAKRFVLACQRGADLGARLENAFRVLLRGHSGAVILGTDSPLLPPRILRVAFNELKVCDAVLGPCPDGGYYLVGLRCRSSNSFRGVRWGTAFAFHDTLENLLMAGHSCSILEPYPDVDVPEDLRRLFRELQRNSSARRLAPSTWEFLVRREITVGGKKGGARHGKK